MKNFVQPGKSIDIVPAADVKSGDMIAIGSFMVGVVAADTASGGVGVADVEGVFDLPKTSALAIAVGDKVYFNTGTKLLTKTNTDVPAGIALLAAANPSPSVRVKLIPGMPL